MEKYIIYILLAMMFIFLYPLEDALHALKDRARADNDEYDLKLAEKAEWITGIVIAILVFAVVFLLER